MRRTVLSLTLAASLAGACPAAAQSPDRFTAEVLVRQEGLGQVRMSPDGRWIAVETQARYDGAQTYVFAQVTSALLSRVELYDTTRRTVRHVLQDADGDTGFVAGPFSPDGRRMVVYRLTPTDWTLGILSLETGTVEWSDITPEETQFGRTVRWLTDTDLLVTAHAARGLPLLFRVGGFAQMRTRELWAATASGVRVGSTYIPSGALRDTRDQAPPLRLLRINVQTGTRTTLAQGALYDVIPSPDGRRLAVMEEREDLQPDPSVPVRVGDPMRRRALRLIDLEAGEVELQVGLDYGPYLMAWSPDSERLLAFARSPGAGDFEQSGAYVVIDRSGQVTQISRAAQPPAIARTLWGEPVALGGWSDASPVLRVRDDTGNLRWRSPDEGIDIEAQADDRLLMWGGRAALRRGDRLLTLALEEIGSGALVGRGDAGDAANRTPWSPDADAWWALRTGGCLTAQDSAQAHCFTAPRPGERVVAATSNALVTREDGADGASRLNVHLSGATKTIATVNTDRAALRWGDLVEVPHEGPTGEPLKSWLLLPPGLPDGVRAPLVLEVYVGRTSSAPPALLGRGSTRLQNNPAVLAAGGYAVLMISLPNPPGARFTGQALAERLLAIVDRAAEGGRIDPARVALLGHSYGGYNVLSAAPHSPRFAAVIASNGAADLTTTLTLPAFYRTAPEEGVPISTSMGWAETGQAAIGRFPADASNYVSLSPLYQVERLTTPALLIESDNDRPRYGALFGALYRLDREAAWLNYFGEGHTIVSPANVRDLHARILEWLGRYLGPPVGDAALPMDSPGLQNGGDKQGVGALPPQEP